MELHARERLREARTAAGLSVRELSRRVGVSPSMLSQIENGRAEPSVATLYGLVSALAISLDDVLGNTHNSPARPPLLVRASDRSVLVMDSGVTWERLTPSADDAVDALLVTYPVGSSSSGNGGLMRHEGREYGYLLAGRLTVEVGFDSFVMEPGDSVTFDSATPHLYRNDGGEVASGIWHVVHDRTAASSVMTDQPSHPARQADDA